MRIKNLVPPLELCKKIPAGEFQDSVFIWMEVEASATMEKTWSLMQGTPYARQRPNRKIPAPTLQEIMAELPACDCYRFSDKNEWTVLLVNGPVDDGVKSDSPATAALKLWLKLKGIEA